MTIYQCLWTFFLYSFLGWCTEVVFQTFKTGKFINRGFLAGPVCPIYGFGVLAVILLITPISGHHFQAYLVAVLVPTVLEYITGWLAEKLFHVRLWNYSGIPLNINGYVCLLFSAVWGGACLVVYYFIQPLLMRLVAILPMVTGWILLAVFAAVMLTDTVLTVIGAARIPKMLAAAEKMEMELRKLSDSIGETLSDGALSLREKHLERRPEQEEKLEAVVERLHAHREELSQRIHAAMAPYERLESRRNGVIKRLNRAFPHTNRTAAHERFESARALLERLRDRDEGKSGS